MFRTHTCGELRNSDINAEVTLAGWVQKSRDLGGMTFVDLRDRYGITQLAFNLEDKPELTEVASKLGREFVIQVTGKVIERSSKNLNIPTGEIEILVEELKIFEKEIDRVLLEEKNNMTLLNQDQIAQQFTPEIERVEGEIKIDDVDIYSNKVNVNELLVYVVGDVVYFSGNPAVYVKKNNL